MVRQQRDVGSSLTPNSCASTAKLNKWNVSEVLRHCSSFGANSSGKATNSWGKDILEACNSFTFFRILIISTGPSRSAGPFPPWFGLELHGRSTHQTEVPAVG